MLGFSIVFGGLNEFNQINAQPEMRWKPQAGCCENKRELEFNTQILFWIRTLRFSTKKKGFFFGSEHSDSRPKKGPCK